MHQAPGSDSLLGEMVDKLGEIPEIPTSTGKDAREIVAFSTDRLWRKFMQVSV